MSFFKECPDCGAHLDKPRKRYAYNDLRGQRFGKLMAIEPTDRRIKGKIVWECMCDCGNRHYATSARLVSGHTKSCGCYSSEKTTQMNTTHGGTHTRLYSIWNTMKTRCYNPKSKSYPWYGARGIALCEDWRKNFASFRQWAYENGYRDDLTIDRIDNDKGYSPENCRWIPLSEQRKNQRRMAKCNTKSARTAEVI